MYQSLEIMPTSSKDICLEHIDPISSDHVCGLRVPLNEILAEGSYNYAKSNKFVPYRVKNHPAPVNPGDTGEFLIDGVWTVLKFYSDRWHAEARRIGCASTKNRSWKTDPDLHVFCSSKGGKAAVKAGYHFTANGCHTSEKQAARTRGLKVWTNSQTLEERKIPKDQLLPEPWIPRRLKVSYDPSGEKWWYNPETDHQLKTRGECPGPGYENRRRRKTDK